MKRCGFSLAEIVIFLFGLAVLFALILPLKAVDLHQAERIAKWKSFYPQLKYAFQTAELNEKSFIRHFTEDKTVNPDELFDVLKLYINTDYAATEKADFSKYRHRFFNGKVISKYSKYRTDKFVVLENGMVIGFNGFDRSKLRDDGDSVGVMLVDIDGITSKNRMGRDVFAVSVYPDRIEPFGEGVSRQEMKTDCSPVGSGIMCSAYYLVGGDF